MPNEFHVWEYKHTPFGASFPSCTGPFGQCVMLDNNIPGGGISSVLGINTPSAAAASTVTYNAWGAPNVGEVVKSSASWGLNGETCMEYMGAFSTQVAPLCTIYGGNYQIYPDCQTCIGPPPPPPPPTPSWDCINGSCIDPGTGNGTYSTLIT